MLVDLQKVVARGYDAKEAQKWPIYDGGDLDRSQYVTASEVGTCARKVKLDKEALKAQKQLGKYDVAFGTKNSSTDDWGFFERGHTMEAWFVDLLAAGWDGAGTQTKDTDLLFTGTGQCSFVNGNQSGTPDGVFFQTIDGVPHVGVLEIKSIDPRVSPRKLPKPEHTPQVIQNLDLVAAQFDAVPIGGELIYINASHYKTMIQFHIPWDEQEAERLELRANGIMEAIGPEYLEPEGIFNGGCKYCAHTARCNAIIAEQRSKKGNSDDLGKAASGLFTR